jgi:hypothetical protein
MEERSGRGGGARGAGSCTGRGCPCEGAASSLASGASCKEASATLLSPWSRGRDVRNVHRGGIWGYEAEVECALCLRGCHGVSAEACVVR